MSKDKPSPVDELKAYLADLPPDTVREELYTSFIDMLDFIIFLGLHNDYLLWEEDKQKYKKLKMLNNRFYHHWLKINNGEQEN